MFKEFPTKYFSQIKICYTRKQEKIYLYGPYGKIILKLHSNINTNEFYMKFSLFLKYLKNNEIDKFKIESIFSRLDYLFFFRLIQNLNEGSSCSLILEGVSNKYFLDLKNKQIVFRLGNSHLNFIPLPKTFFWFRKQHNKKEFILHGVSHDFVSLFASKLVKLKKHNAYKRKGIYYKFKKLPPLRKSRKTF